MISMFYYDSYSKRISVNNFCCGVSTLMLVLVLKIFHIYVCSTDIIHCTGVMDIILLA